MEILENIVIEQYPNQNFYNYILANRFAIKEKAIHHITRYIRLRLHGSLRANSFSFQSNDLRI